MRAADVRDASRFDRIGIPVIAYLVASVRDEVGVRALIGKANDIWLQAQIHFDLADVRAQTGLLPWTIQEMLTHVDATETTKVFFAGSAPLEVQSLVGRVNGHAWQQQRVVFVADFTTVHDFRTTAHELGHLLGLKHPLAPADPDRLMAPGQNGKVLSEEEIQIARDEAERQFGFP